MEQGLQYGRGRQFQRGQWGSAGRLDSLSYAVVMVTVVLLGLVWWQTITRIDRESELSIAAAQAGNQNMAHLVAGYFDQLQDRLAGFARDAEVLLEGDRAAAGRIDGALRDDRALLGLVVLDANATVRHRSAGRTIDRGQIDWAAAQLGKADGLLRPTVKQPLPDDLRMTWLVPLRRTGTADKAVGALLVNVDLRYFFNFFKPLELGERGELSLLADEGFELMRSRRDGLLPPRSSSAAAYLVAGGVHHVTQFGAIDDASERRLFALAKVGAGGFYVAVSRPQSEVTELNALVHQRYLLWALLASLVTGVVTFSLVKLMRRQSEMLAVLARTEQENQRLIRQIDEEKTRAYQLAYYDQLTGLPNRTFFRAMSLDRLVGSRRRRKASAILFIDLDRFKAVNDTHGHRIGDQLLVEVSRRLRTALRESDLVSRFGGDEFVIQVDDLDTVAHLDMLAAKVVEVIGAPFRLQECEVDVLPSIGIAVCPQDGETVDQLIRNADAAMYEAKRAGRGLYRFFDAQLNAQAQRYLNLEQRFKHAIAGGEFVVHYQPRINASGYRIVSLEALVRWQHPEYGMVYPGDFIPLAEDTGHIVELGAAILHQVCGQIARWRQAGLHTPSVAVNVSAKQLTDGGFIQLLRDAVDQAGISYVDLEIEVTESCVMEDPEVSAAILEALVALGVRISLDDYGTGYSSLSSIKRLPLYAIKIDRSFVADIGIDSNDDVIVASTISMGHGLGLRVVAEGVETRAQLKRLRLLGCEEVQGYLFSRPLPVAEIGKMLRSGRCEPQSVVEEAA